MKTCHHQNKQAGFTLAELLTVVTIIVILAGLTVIAVTWIPKFVATKRAEVQLKLLDDAMIRYAADVGDAPVARDASGLTMYYVLFGDGVGADGIMGTADDGPIDGKRDTGATSYLPQLNPATNPLGLLELGSDGLPTRVVDPFGNAWHYTSGLKYRPQMNNKDFDIHSPGADGAGTAVTPGADDFHNW